MRGLIQVPGTEFIAVVAHAMGIAETGLSSVGQPDVPVVRAAQLRPAFFVADDFLEADPVSRRVDVKFSDRPGLIPVLAEHVGQQGKIRSWQIRLEDTIAVLARCRPGHH